MARALVPAYDWKSSYVSTKIARTLHAQQEGKVKNRIFAGKSSGAVFKNCALLVQASEGVCGKKAFRDVWRQDCHGALPNITGFGGGVWQKTRFVTFDGKLSRLPYAL